MQPSKANGIFSADEDHMGSIYCWLNGWTVPENDTCFLSSFLLLIAKSPGLYQ